VMQVAQSIIFQDLLFFQISFLNFEFSFNFVEDFVGCILLD
jgi:hypothetical protein